MVHIINWLFKLIVFFTVGMPTLALLILLSLLMWDYRFFDTADNIAEYIFRNRR